MFCPHCGTKLENVPSFCASCGKKLDKAEVAQKWLQDYFQGSMKSNTGEIWTYEKGNVKCLEGNPKGTIYQWDGTNFVPENKAGPTGSVSGNKLTWKYPTQKELFYVYQMDETSGKFRNESGLMRVDPVIYTSFVHWKWDKKTIQVEDSSDMKEGTSTKWEIASDFPPPVCLFIAMFNWSQKLMEDAIARSKRMYKRCGKLVLQSGGTTLLCNVCAPSGKPDLCIVCNKDCSNDKYQGKICKTCTPKKNYCAKCSDPLTKANQREGYLCIDCGLGKTGDNCAKMLYTIRT